MSEFSPENVNRLADETLDNYEEVDYGQEYIAERSADTLNDSAGDFEDWTEIRP